MALAVTEAVVTPSLPPFGDTICGIVCILVLVLGILGNIPAIMIFSSDLSSKVYINEKKLCFDSLFVCISITDTVICCCMLPVLLSFFEGRDPAFFGNQTFCKVWGVVWTILPYFSIFLVAVLSFTRTYTLLRPLGAVSCRYIMTTIAVYLAFLVLRSVVPLLATNYTTYIYFNDSVACMEYITEVNTYWHFKMVANQVQLLLPIFPVTISCIVSIVVLCRKRVKLQVGNRVAKMQSEATRTILVVTLFYWVCNVPVLINYMYFHINTSRGHQYYHLYGSVFMYWYSWPVTLSLSVGLNSLLNPLVYLSRMKRFRDFFVENYKTVTVMISVTGRPSLVELASRARASKCSSALILKELPEETIAQCRL